LAPAGTPADVISRIQSEVARIMRLPEVVERMNKLDIRAAGTTSQEMAQTIAQEIKLWSSVAKTHQISAN
jgi:tripartite-type tricarboxylate transporter receptor subunit TctC